jgi:hypothetical protein
MATLVSKIKNEPPARPPYSHVGNQSNGGDVSSLKTWARGQVVSASPERGQIGYKDGILLF